MAIKKSYVGNVIVSQYNTLDTYADNGQVVEGFRTEGQARIETAPTDPYHVIRLTDVGTLIQGVSDTATSTSGTFANRPAVGGPGDYYYAYDTGVMYSWDDDTDAWVQVSTWNGILTGTLAGRPTAEFYGRYYWAGDVNYLFFDNGIQWITVNGIGFGVLADRPAVMANVFYYATDTLTLYYSNGTTWAAIGGSTFAQAVTVTAGGVQVTGNSTITGNLTVTGIITTAGTASLTGGARINQATDGSTVLELSSDLAAGIPAEYTYQYAVATTTNAVTALMTKSLTATYSYLFEAKVIARRTGGSAGTAGDTAGYIISGIFRNISGTVTQVGSTTASLTGESQAGWDCVFAISGTNLLINVTGATNNNITWFATVRFIGSVSA